MRLRIPVLRETWDRLEKLPVSLRAAARSARKMGTALTDDDLSVSYSFPEPDDQAGYMVCRRAFRETVVSQVLVQESTLVKGSGTDWDAVATEAATLAAAPKLPTGPRRLVDVAISEGLAKKAHGAAGVLMGKPSAPWEDYLETRGGTAPRIAEMVRKALLEGDMRFQAWRNEMEAWDGVTAPPVWPTIRQVAAPSVVEDTGARWTCERVLGAWVDAWAKSFQPLQPNVMTSALSVVVDGEVTQWRSLYWTGTTGRRMAIAPWSVEQEAWIRKRIREARKSLLSA